MILLNSFRSTETWARICSLGMFQLRRPLSIEHERRVELLKLNKALIVLDRVFGRDVDSCDAVPDAAVGVFPLSGHVDQFIVSQKQ